MNSRFSFHSKSGFYAIGQKLLFLSLLFCFEQATAQEPDWREGVRIESPRSNPYGLSPAEFESSKRRGAHHVMNYPVEVSGMQVPWKPIKALLEGSGPTPFHQIAQSIFKGLSGIRSTDDFFALLGLVSPPERPEDGSPEIPSTSGKRLGVTIERRNGVEAFTLSCAACHTSDLFGKKIFGLSNRFPRANTFFVHGKRAMSLITPETLERFGGASREERLLYEKARKSARAVGAISPAAIGLDTSLAQVALSLAKREDDEIASFSRMRELFPRRERLANFTADSKPAVWWNLKYKNRWLSDGSVLSGNPIYTNFLWNEIGRGTDLETLEDWLKENSGVIQDLTTAVFATEAPRITDFFPAERISIERARRGEHHFKNACANCHGVYEKNWNLPNADVLPLIERLKTTSVFYPNSTPVKNVGTDPNRWMGMKSLEKGLNPLRISAENGIRIESQTGYVPPPLVGIWARFPYFHNNSVPNLCALLSPSQKRPKHYWSGPAIDQDRDYDFDCVGYPTGDRTPAQWKKAKRHLFDTNQPGLSNSGHDVGIFIRNGEEVFSPEEKKDLIEFLKTL